MQCMAKIQNEHLYIILNAIGIVVIGEISVS